VPSSGPRILVAVDALVVGGVEGAGFFPLQRKTDVGSRLLLLVFWPEQSQSTFTRMAKMDWTPLISQIVSGLKEVRQKLADTATVSQEDVSNVQTTAREEW
jgi:hypothetical protein